MEQHARAMKNTIPIVLNPCLLLVSSNFFMKSISFCSIFNLYDGKLIQLLHLLQPIRTIAFFILQPQTNGEIIKIPKTIEHIANTSMIYLLFFFLWSIFKQRYNVTGIIRGNRQIAAASCTWSKVKEHDSDIVSHVTITYVTI